MNTEHERWKDENPEAHAILVSSKRLSTALKVAVVGIFIWQVVEHGWSGLWRGVLWSLAAFVVGVLIQGLCTKHFERKLLSRLAAAREARD